VRPLPYPLPHTLTIFLGLADADFSPGQTLRLRSYCALSDLTADGVRRAVADGLPGKLQVKAPRGRITELLEGPVSFLHATAERERGAWERLQIGDRALKPASVRVARRLHYELPGSPARVTVDLERSLFRVAAGELRCLGDMGPRIEIKAPRSADVRQALQTLDPDGLLRRLRYGSLELLFQDLLRDVVRPMSGRDNPEIEAKFELPDSGTGTGVTVVASVVTEWLRRQPGIRLLLPLPHQVVRMRRYHFCEGDDDGAQCTIVETAAGRLSAKVKRNAAAEGLLLLRSTEASRSTNVDGAREPVDVFAQRHGWRRFNTMTKVQAKIPFAVRSGHAYLVSVDDCVDGQGRTLRQLELEAIGSLGASPSRTSVLCAELQALAARLHAELPELSLRPTAESKFAWYLRHRDR
jgi:hypothetical protein